MLRHTGALKVKLVNTGTSAREFEKQLKAREEYEKRQQEIAEQRRRRQVRSRGVANSLLLDEEQDVFVEFAGSGDSWDDGIEPPCSDTAFVRGAGRQQASSSSGASRRSHTDNVRRQETTWREADQLDIAVAVAHAGALALQRAEDRAFALGVLQQRINDYASRPHHPCPSSPGGITVRVTQRRQVLCHTLLGSGIIEVPQFSCSACGDFEMSPAAVGCQRSSPNPTIWFDHWLCSAASKFGTRAGVALSTFCSTADALVAEPEQLSAEPRMAPSLSEKALAGALRHWEFVQREARDPSQHGAAIFDGPLGHCPPCCGALLMAGAALRCPGSVPREVYAQQPIATAPQGINLAASSAGAQAGCERPDVLDEEVVAAMECNLEDPEAAAQSLQASPTGGAAASVDPGSSAVEAGPADAALQPVQSVEGVPAAAAAQHSNLPGFMGAGLFPLVRRLPLAARLPFLHGRQAHALLPCSQRRLGTNWDANVKTNHYENCGRATTKAYQEAGLKPLYMTYFAEGGTLAKELIIGLTSLRGGQADGDTGSGCDAHLTCARPLATKGGGVTDVKCTVGGCCAPHGVPLKKGFLSGETPEQFAHYVALLHTVLPLLPGVLAVLLDINCQFGKHLQTKYSSVATGLQFYIGWLHARAGHNIDCQLGFSSMFQEGMGRCVGELIEQLWAFLKGVSRRGRYMALPHRQELLEIALDSFATSKNQRMHELLVQSWTHARRRQHQLLQEKEEVLRAGRQHRVELDPSATYVRQAAAAVQLDDAAQYVKKLAARRVSEQLSTVGGAVLAGMEAPLARALAAQAGDAARRKLDADILRLRQRLGIPDGSPDWDDTLGEFQEAAKRLRDAQLLAVQQKVERQVSHLATLREDRQAEVQSGHNSGLIRDKIRYRTRLIRQLMSEWEAWWTFMQPSEVRPPVWAEEDVFNNTLPWTEASLAQGISADHLRFKLYSIHQELLRTEEELLYLPQDGLNSLAYYQYQQQLLQAAQSRCQLQLQTAAVPWEQQYLGGRLHILQSWQAHVGRLHRAAWAAFAKVGWVAPPVL